MGLFSKSKKQPKSTDFILNPCGGDVLTFQSKYGTYLTACEDKQTVTLEEKLPGSNNRQCWTVVRYRPSPNRTVLSLYFLRSIYGTFLAPRGNDGVCQAYWPAEVSSPTYMRSAGVLLWRLLCMNDVDSPVDWAAVLNMSSFYLQPNEDGILELDKTPQLSWLVRLVDWDKNTVFAPYPQQQQRNTPTSAPSPSATTPNHPSPSPSIRQSEHSEKTDKPKVVSINFNNQLGSTSGPGGPSSLCNTGQNFNGSGTQKNGDVDVRNNVGRYEHLYFTFR